MNENESRVLLLRNRMNDRAFVRIRRFGMRVAMLSVLNKFKTESKRTSITNENDVEPLACATLSGCVYSYQTVTILMCESPRSCF